MPTVKYTVESYMLWAYLFAGGPGHLVQIQGIMDSFKYKQIKNQNLTPSARNLIMAVVGSSIRSTVQNKHKKSTQTCVTEHKW